MKLTTLKIALFSLLFCGIAANAQEQDQSYPTLNVAMDTRADFTCDDVKGEGTSTGIHGRYLNLMVDGNISRELSFSWRQRMNRFSDLGNDVFTATDWIYLSYRPHTNFSIAGGKQVVLIGGYEYDATPIDIFFASRFWNNIACYQFGASASYHSTDGNHTLTFQACNSPYQKIGSSCFAYNLYWSGDMGHYKTLWSVNLIEYMRGHYTTFIALGNQFEFGPLNFQLDLMNRATDKQKFWFADYSIIAKAEYKVTPWMTIMAKGGYDDISVIPGDYEAMPGTEFTVDNPFYGGGFEFYPMHGSRNLKLHAVYSLYHLNDGTRMTQLNIGLKWKINLYSKK